MRKLKLVLAYEGTRYHGWQFQKNAPSIQKTLERAFAKILKEPVRIIGTSRTDSGVHALHQVAHTMVLSPMPLSQLLKALNAVLPDDILVKSIRKVPASFHARYGAARKWYRYTIWNKRERPLFSRNFVHHIPEPLDLRAMRRAARNLTGRRDFQAFQSTGRKVASTIRTVRRLSIRTADGIIRLDFEADGFLYHMVRRMVGLLIEVGKGRTAPAVAPTAPAQGLCLMRIWYGS